MFVLHVVDMSKRFVVSGDFGDRDVSYDVEELSFWGMNIGVLPPELWSCGRLRHLDLSGNRVGRIWNLEKLPLESLKADYCELDCISGLPSRLRVLSATNNRLAAVRIGECVESLRLSGNRLRQVPRGAALRELHLGGNPIPFLEGFGGVRELEISLECARAVALPDSLQVLELSGPRGSEDVHAQLLAELPASLREIRYNSCDFRLPVDGVVASGAWRAPFRPRREEFDILPFEEAPHRHPPRPLKPQK